MTSRTEVGEKNGTTSTGTNPIIDRTNTTWALSQAAAVAGLKTGYAVNKGGVDTNFPNGQCSMLFFKDANLFGKKIKGGWFKWSGTAWVATNNPRDM